MAENPTVNELKQRIADLENELAERRAHDHSIIDDLDTRYSIIFESVPTSIVIIDKNGNIVDINPYHITHIGQGKTVKKDYLNHNILNFPSVISAGLQQEHKEVLDGKSMNLKRIHYPMTTGGRDRYFNIRGVPLFKNNEITGAVIIHEDISDVVSSEKNLKKLHDELELRIETRTAELKQEIIERKQIEKNLVLSKQKLDLHFLQTPLAVIEWDLESRVRSWNPAAEKIFGYTENEILGKHSSIIVPEKCQNQIDMVWSDLIAQRGGTRSTNENITKNGENIFCEWFNTPIIDKTGKTIAVFSLAQDVTAQRQTQEEIQKRTTELKRLNDHLVFLEDSERKNLASELHDSVAQSLAMAVSTIKTINETDSGYGKEALPTVQKNIENAIKEVRILIQRLHPQILEDFNIDIVIGCLIEAVNEKEQIQITYINNLTESVTLAEATKMTVYRAINELISNILRHSDASAAEIELTKINNSIRISVEDNGKGFEFNTYHQKNYCGFGLYSLSERIKNMCGKLIIDSSLGKGTKVIMIVPVDVT